MENENTFDELTDLNQLVSNKIQQKKSIADKISYVDIDNIEMEEPNIENQQKSIISIFNSKPSVQVTCSQSGYMAKLSALMYRDIVTITNSNLSNYENKKEIYKILYSKITGYSAENWHPKFEEWLKATSLGDVETLFYGLYCATFQDTSTIRFQCPNCDETEIATIDNKRLIRVEDKKEMLEITNRINKEADTFEKIKEFSSVSDKKINIKSIKLPDSKIIFSLKMPTLEVTLNLLKTFSDEDLATKTTDSLNVMLSTNKVAIPNNETGKYSFIESKEDIFTLIDMLSVDDISVLKEVVSNMLEEKHITYCIENQKCEHCKTVIPQIPLDIENLLFFQISEKQLS